MRDKTECTAFAVKEHFEAEIVPKLDQMKTVVPDARLLKEVSHIEFHSNNFKNCLITEFHFHLTVPWLSNEEIVYDADAAQQNTLDVQGDITDAFKS